jgi:hypothetical protein
VVVMKPALLFPWVVNWCLGNGCVDIPAEKTRDADVRRFASILHCLDIINRSMEGRSISCVPAVANRI